ncbi:autotransporter passenger strand-loop-strand repeat-containing protein [Bradyrhizobium erythrophlei]|uniref:Autotransporter passenger strand-loop-strand repeat-containing protein n=1 Tax=Bradyrhizobium erythrophlei TaxID=1437360 RepID=A0A1H5ELN2_9BRAD|nr:autotransporter passenger strand-loop-strand repeat-containing protein [Bradyrhizobium erythrophlei]
MSTTFVSSGVISSGLTETGGNTLEVLSGGFASVTTLSGGQLLVDAGGYAVGTTISSGGSAVVGAGGAGDRFAVSSGGTLNVAGTVNSFTAVFTGGVENIEAGGFISGAVGSGTGISGGTVNVLAGGSASYLSVSSGGVFNVAGTTLSMIGVRSGGVENVLAGGFISGATNSGTGVSAGGILNLQAGGSAVHVGVSSGGTFNVAGSVLSNAAVYAGGVENILSGGSISGASGSGTGVSGGTLNLSAGGTASYVGVSAGGIFNVAGTVLSSVGVYSGGVENVLSGGVVQGVSGGFGTAISGGTVNVQSGAAATAMFVYTGGALNDSGIITNQFVLSGGVETVSSGGLASGVQVSGGGLLDILAGGSATSVGDAGRVIVEAGGTADHILVSAGGVLSVGGTVTSNTGILVGGVETVLSGGLISGTSGAGTGISGGTLNLLAGGSAVFVGVSSGGTFNVAGTVLSNGMVFAGGVENVQSGGLITGAISSGTGVIGTLNVQAGGSAAYVGVSSGGTFNVAGIVLSNVAVYGGGVENVLSGGVVTGVTGSGTGISGGTVNVFGGGALDHLTVSSGTLNVSAGGTVHNITVSNGGTMNVAGTITSNTLVSSGGIENVLSGGLISGATSSGTGVLGTLNLLAGGSAVHVGVSSGGTFNVAGTVLGNVGVYDGGVENVLAGGVVTGVPGSGTGVSGGTVNVLSGGALDHLTVSSGTLNVSAGGTAHDVTVSSGTLNVAGTIISNTLVSSGGTENVLSGGLISGASSAATIISAGGIVNVLAGGSAVHVGVSSGGIFNVAGKVLSNTGIYNGGVENVLSGGSISGASGSGTGVSGGTLNLSAGATAAFVGVSSGGIFNVAGTVLSNVSINSGGVENVLSGGLITGAVSSGTGVSAGGVLNVLVGGSAAFVGVSSGGIFNVSGTVLSRVGVYAGGVENVFSGGVVTGAVGSGTAVSGGTVNVFSGGALDHLTVSSGGVFNIASGGTAHDIAVSSGGALNLAGTTTSNVFVFAGGSEIVSSGGSAGAVTISGGVVELQAGSLASGIAFSGSGGQLKIDGTSLAGTTVSGLVLGDSIDLAGLSFVSGGSASLLPGNILHVTEGASSFDLHLDQTPGVRFSVGADSGTGTLVTTRADIAPVTSAPNVTAIFGESSALASSLFSVTDADGDPITQYAFWDTQGNGHWVLNGVVQATNAEIDVAAANLSQVSYVFGPSGSTDTLFVRANDGTVWSGWTQFTAKSFVDTAPTVNAANVTAAHGQTSIAASSLFTVSDPDPDTMTQYAFWDTGGSGHWVVNGVAQAANTEIDITAAQLSQVSYVFGPAGSAPDTLFIKANDGTLWGAWQSFTATPGIDTAPVVSAANVTAAHGQTSALASSLFSTSDAESDPITQYAFWDTGGNGHWVVNGVAQAANVEIDVAAANLSQVSYVFGPGGSMPDTLYVRANDGSLWGAWKSFTAAPGIDTAPVVTAANVTAAHGQTSALASSLFSTSDAESDPITQYAFWDTGGNGHWVVNGVAQAANVEIDVAAANLSQVSYVFGPGGSMPDTLYVRANDGSLWGAWKAFTAGPGVDTAPVVTAANVTAAHGQTSALASSLFSTSDAESDPMTQYAFWDTGGSGHWVVNGVAQAANTEIDVAAANLSQVSYVFGPGGSTPDTLFVRANDGSLWSTWTSFTAGPGVDTAPVVTAANVTAAHGQTSALASSLFSTSDAESDPMTQYAFWDTGGNGHWVVNGVAQAANVEIDVAAANLSQVSYVFGPGGSTPDTLYVRANDGSKWSNWAAFTATPGIDTAPVVTAANVAAVHGEASTLASSLFSTSDAESDPITQYAFWDTGGNGHWVVNGVAQAANTEIDVSAANLSQVSYVFGPGNSTPDTLYVRANDGSKWSTWTAFTATPGPDTAPVVTAANVAAVHGETSTLASSLFSTSDAESDPITQYAFWDTGGNGHWVVNGVAQAANAEIDVAAANLSQVSYVFGPGNSTPDTLYVRANDGSEWGAWTAFTATPGPDTAPVVTASNVSGIHGHSVAASTLFSTSDAESDPITQYAFWDTGGNGHWVVNGVAQAANAEIDVAAANLSQVSYVFGPGGSPSDTLYVRANDGSEWSSWKAFTATATNQAPTVAVSNVVTVSGQTFAAANLVTATDADGDAITKYALWDSNTNGRWNVGGVNEPANTEIDVTAAQLAQVTYQAGSGTDQLWIRANDGTAWGAWQSFNVTGESPSSATIVPSGTLELTGASNASVAFQGSTGTLKLDNSASFNGTVAGMTGSDAIDFANINFANVHTPTFSGDSSHGTLTVTDGTVTASIALLGNYMASTFTTSSDGHGGTLVVDPPAMQVSQLAQPQHA